MSSLPPADAMGPHAITRDVEQPPNKPVAQPPKRPKRVDGLAHPLLSLPVVGYILVGFCIPLGILLAYSFWPTRESEVIVGDWTLRNYERFFTDETYWRTLVDTFAFVGIASAITVVATFPFAYYVALRVRPSRRLTWVLLAILPFAASYLIRVFAWLNLFGEGGIINDTLMRIGITDEPLGFFGFNTPAVIMTFVYLLFPLAFLTLFIAIERMNPALLEAASDLGAKPWKALSWIVVPIARTGLLVAFSFCFVTMIGDYVTPQLIGGTRTTLFSVLVVNKFGLSAQWGFGAALALILLVSMLVFLLIARRTTGAVDAVGEFNRNYQHRRAPFLTAYSVAFTGVLYVPIVLLILFAFNDSDFVGFPIQGITTSWFTAVFDNPLLLDSLKTSLVVAAWAVGISLTFGTVAAVQLARARGRWRSLSVGIVALPLLLPPVLLGLGIIIGLNAVGLERGLWTIIAGHTLLILPLVTLIVLVRLEGLDPNLERAAMDLGAKPWQAFLRVSLPQAVPGIVAGALIGFALSMDEFILTFLVTGSQATLPLYIYGAIRFEISPELNAVSSMMVLSSFLLVTIAGLLIRGWGKRSNKRRRRAATPSAKTRQVP